jgi:hypothetical protein
MDCAHTGIILNHMQKPRPKGDVARIHHRRGQRAGDEISQTRRITGKCLVLGDTAGLCHPTHVLFIRGSDKIILGCEMIPN